MQDFKVRDPEFEERVKKSFAAQGMMDHIGARLRRIEPGFCEIELPFSNGVSQQHGFFHGGVIGTIADTAGGYAAFTLMGAEDGILTVEFKLNLMAPADGEMLIARGEVIRPGKTLTVCRAEVDIIKDGRETPCAIMQQTLMRISGHADVTG